MNYVAAIADVPHAKWNNWIIQESFVQHITDCLTVGSEQANVHGTDEPDDDGFILVGGRRKNKAERGYGAVAPVPVNMSGNEWTGKETLVNEESKVV